MLSPIDSPVFFALPRYSFAFLLKSSRFMFQLTVLVFAGVGVGVAVATALTLVARLALVLVLALSLPLHAAAKLSAAPASSARTVFLFIPSPVVVSDPSQRTRARRGLRRANGGPQTLLGMYVWVKARAILTPRAFAGQGKKRLEVGGQRLVLGRRGRPASITDG